MQLESAAAVRTSAAILPSARAGSSRESIRGVQIVVTATRSRVRWVLLLLIAAAAAYSQFATETSVDPSPPASSGSDFARLFREQQSGVIVEGIGRVAKVLPDDLDGSRHQRFILRLDSEPSILISHNIDLAPRVAKLAVGDSVRFRGQYEWNDRGGVVHWTHHDPSGQRQGGWLDHAGRIYQ